MAPTLSPRPATGAGTTGNNFDYASASGTDADAQAGDDPHSEFADASTGNSFDSATASGNDASAYAGFDGSYDDAAASGNVANANAGDNGNGDFASAIGGNTDAEAGESGLTVPANDDTAIVLGNLTTAETGLTQAIAGGGFSLSNVIGDGGSNDISFTTDPFGTVGSDAVSGLGNNFDLAGVFGDDYVANAFATGNLIDHPAVVMTAAPATCSRARAWLQNLESSRPNWLSPFRPHAPRPPIPLAVQAGCGRRLAAR